MKKRLRKKVLKRMSFDELKEELNQTEQEIKNQKTKKQKAKKQIKKKGIQLQKVSTKAGTQKMGLDGIVDRNESINVSIRGGLDKLLEPDEEDQIVSPEREILREGS